MKKNTKVIRLTENDLERIVKRIIKEEDGADLLTKTMYENKWLFSSYKNENDYTNNHPFFEKEFTDFNKMKSFSANHSHLNKKVYPNYCSKYEKFG